MLSAHGIGSLGRSCDTFTSPRRMLIQLSIRLFNVLAVLTGASRVLLCFLRVQIPNSLLVANLKYESCRSWYMMKMFNSLCLFFLLLLVRFCPHCDMYYKTYKAKRSLVLLEPLMQRMLKVKKNFCHRVLFVCGSISVIDNNSNRRIKTAWNSVTVVPTCLWVLELLQKYFGYHQGLLT